MSQLEIVSSFVEGAPPGELADVVADIKSLTLSSPDIISDLAPAFEKYNEEQLVTVKLPGSSQPVLISSHNSLGDGRYYDVESSSSFAFDHKTQKPSDVQSHLLQGPQTDLVKSTLKSVVTYVKEHFASAACGAYPIESESKIAVVIVANKYSPNNFWNGRWRSVYVFDPASGSLDGSIKVDVHYYEDGNVRLLTNKAITASIPSGTGGGIAKEISTAEKKYQEELNNGFVNLSEGAFKGLRRQLPVTRQKNRMGQGDELPAGAGHWGRRGQAVDAETGRAEGTCRFSPPLVASRKGHGWVDIFGYYAPRWIPTVTSLKQPIQTRSNSELAE